MLDINALQNDYAGVKEEGKQSFGKNFVRIPEGKCTVVLRLLPPAPPGMFGRQKNFFYQETRLHRVNEKSLHDPCELVNGRWVGNNPIRDYLRWLWKESEKAPTAAEKERMQALYRQLKPVARYYYNCIVRSVTDDNGNVKTNVGPLILSVGVTVHEAILRGICGDKDLSIPALGDVTDFKTGRDFRLVKTIRKSGENSFPNYDGSHFAEPSAAGNPDEIERWMKDLHDLAALRVFKSPEEMDHELQVHLGVKQDVAASGFDPSRYQKQAPVAERVQVRETPKAVTPTMPPVMPTNTASLDEEDLDLVDPDFFNDLKNSK